MSTDRQDATFRALANPTRRSLLDLLKHGPRTTGEICEHLADLDRCTVMQHLAVLEGADLIIVKREGRVRWNYLNAVPIKEIHDRWISPHARDAVNVLARLKAALESPSASPVEPRASGSPRRTGHVPRQRSRAS